MTHDELVARAGRWLRGTMKCGVVLCEVIGGGLEQADAIGWKHGGRHSILVEVKTSRADFHRDKKKWHRQAGMGMGQERWYFTPPGILTAKDLPEGWGLAENHGRFVRKKVNPPKLECWDFEKTRREMGLLFSAMRKVTLGIAPDRFGDWPTLESPPEEVDTKPASEFA